MLITQKKTADRGQQKQQKYKEIHSFSQKPSLAQVMAYILSLLQICITYTIIRSRLGDQLFKVFFLVFYSTVQAIKVLLTVYVSLKDPSDPLMILCKNNTDGTLEQSIKQLKSTIKNYMFCRECYSFVKPSSKHCKKCQRCVDNFDHHCIWLNNCIGSINYKPFVGLLVACWLGGVLHIVAASYLSFQAQYSVSYPLYEIIIVWVNLAFVCLFWIFITNLLILHIYLIKNQLTTYQWLFPHKRNKHSFSTSQQNRQKRTQQAYDFQIDGNNSNSNNNNNQQHNHNANRNRNGADKTESQPSVSVDQINESISSNNQNDEITYKVKVNRINNKQGKHARGTRQIQKINNSFQISKSSENIQMSAFGISNKKCKRNQIIPIQLQSQPGQFQNNRTEQNILASQQLNGNYGIQNFYFGKEKPQAIQFRNSAQLLKSMLVSQKKRNNKSQPLIEQNIGGKQITSDNLICENKNIKMGGENFEKIASYSDQNKLSEYATKQLNSVGKQAIQLQQDLRLGNINTRAIKQAKSQKLVPLDNIRNRNLNKKKDSYDRQGEVMQKQKMNQQYPKSKSRSLQCLVSMIKQTDVILPLQLYT